MNGHIFIGEPITIQINILGPDTHTILKTFKIIVHNKLTIIE